MESEQLPGKLLSRYESIRRQEHEHITGLLDILGRVDGLGDDEMEQVRDALFHTNHPFLMVLVGPFGSGKSSIINAMLGQEVMVAGPTPTTDHIMIVRYGTEVQRTRAGDIETVFHPSSLLQNLSLVDTPGLDSVFRAHEDVTRRFMHRADVVLLVMIATQVFTESNLEYLKQLKTFGKRVIVVVNQIDLLNSEDRDRVREFVREQSRVLLGIDPLIWLISARQALAAQQEQPRDEIAWDESGFAEMEEYIRETLGDVERFRQKLETPVQICQNVTKTALACVQDQQVVLDEHRKTVENIERQIEEGHREQEKNVEDTLDEIRRTWDEAAGRGDEAIADLFQFSRGIALFFGGLGEIIGVARLLRRFRGQTRAESAFEQFKVRETLQHIPQVVDRMGPLLEGRDLQDIDDLVDYTRGAVQKLPPNLLNKVVGKVQTPLHYERSFLRDVRGKLDDLLRDAQRFETERLDRMLRNALIMLAVWEVLTLCLVLSAAAGAFSGTMPDASGMVLTFAVGVGFVLFGLALVPLRGWLIRRRYVHRLHDLRDDYLEILERAANDLVAHGVRLRRDATGPFTRLISSQSEQLGALRIDLMDQQQTLIQLQSELADLEQIKRGSRAAEDEAHV